MNETTQLPLTLLERLKASRPKLEIVETKGLGRLYMRRQTGEDHLKISALQQEIGPTTLEKLPASTWAAVVGAVMLLNEDGTPAFEDVKAGYELLKECDAGDLHELYKALMKHHQGGASMEEAEKKSSSSQTSEPGTN